MRKSWLRRTRQQWLRSGFIFGGLIVPANVSLIWLPGNWHWAVGFFSGGLVGAFFMARESPPGYIEQWQLGGWGEERTEKALQPLEKEGWRLHHDLPAPGGRGNWDHVAIGPGGVFLLDTKSWQGEVTVEGDVALVRRLEDPSLSYRYEIGRKLIPLALQVRDHLRQETRASQYVQCVVVVWASFPQTVAGDRCAVVHGERIAEWLREQPLRVAPDRVKQFSDALASRA